MPWERNSGRIWAKWDKCLICAVLLALLIGVLFAFLKYSADHW